MTTRMKASEQEKLWKRYICRKQAGKLRVWSPSKSRDSILGTVDVVKRMSRAERLIRKKYMGLWRLGSATTATRMRVVPTRMSSRREERGESRKEEGFWQRGEAVR